MSDKIRLYNNSGNIRIECDDADAVVTITGGIEHGELKNSCTYKITAGGKISICETAGGKSSTGILDNIVNTIETDKVKQKKQIPQNVLNKDAFQSIPDNLSANEMKRIKKYAEENIVMTTGFGKMYPYTVKQNDEGDIEAILLMYNGNGQPFELTKFPFKLMDANNQVIILDFVDINTIINPKKIGICQVKISKDNLLEKNIDLSNWNITFEAS